MEEYIKNEKRLKKNIEVLENTFLSAGFELKNIGVQYAQMVGGAGIKFYCEILAVENIPDDTKYNVKVNVYDKNGALISMGAVSFSSNDFTGYDTFTIAVFHDTIHASATKAKVYLTK